jgi:hypothetical protein
MQAISRQCKTRAPRAKAALLGALALLAGANGCGDAGSPAPGDPGHAQRSSAQTDAVIRPVQLPEHRTPRRHAVQPRSIRAAAACTTNTDKSQPAAASYVLDNGIVTGLYATPDDAGWNANAHFNGGAVVGSAQLQLIFWGSAWSQPSTSPSANTLVGTVLKLLGTGYFSGLTQYGFQGFSPPNAVLVPSDPPTTYGTSDATDVVEDLISNGTLPGTDDPRGRSVYVVFMPPGTNRPPDEDGAHTLDDGLWVAWVGNNSLDRMTEVFSHEMVETISDPEPTSGWVMDTFLNCGVEFGDACWHTDGLVNGIVTQAYWSQRQHACVIPTFPLPAVASVSPSSGPIGGGTTVTVTGQSFDPQSGHTQIFFGGVPATAVSCSSPGSCTAVTPPAGQIGPLDVKVVVNTFSSTTNATYIALPQVTGVSPNRANPGDQVVVSGYPFNYLPSVMSISIGSLHVDTFTCGVTSCTITVPSGCTGGDVAVTINGLTSQPNPKDLFSFQGPSIDSIAPASGPPFGGTDVNLTGSGMDTHMDVRFVDTATGLSVPSPRVWCPYSTWCIATSPPHDDTAGYAWVQASLPGCSTARAYLPFTYLPPAKVVTGISIDSAGAGLVQLDSVALENGAQVALTSSDPGALGVPSTVTVPAGGTTGSFNVSFLTSTKTETVTVTASFGGATVSTTVQLVAVPPPPPPPPSLTLTCPSELMYRGSGLCVVALVPAAPAGGTVVTLAPSDANALVVPASVAVAAGSTTASFSVRSQYASNALETVTVVATGGGLTGSAAIDLKRTFALR